jgi:hypothetical protein
MKFFKICGYFILICLSTNIYASDITMTERAKKLAADDLANHKVKCTRTSPCESYLIYFKYKKYPQYSGCGIKLTRSDHEAICPSDINKKSFDEERNIVGNISYYFNGDNLVYKLINKE